MILPYQRFKPTRYLYPVNVSFDFHTEIRTELRQQIPYSEITYILLTPLFKKVTQGRIQEFWLGGGGGVFFFKDMGSEGRLKASSGSSSWILMILGVIFNHIVNPHRPNYTLS